MHCRQCRGCGIETRGRGAIKSVASRSQSRADEAHLGDGLAKVVVADDCGDRRVVEVRVEHEEHEVQHSDRQRRHDEEDAHRQQHQRQRALARRVHLLLPRAARRKRRQRLERRSRVQRARAARALPRRRALLRGARAGARAVRALERHVRVAGLRTLGCARGGRERQRARLGASGHVGHARIAAVSRLVVRCDEDHRRGRVLMARLLVLVHVGADAAILVQLVDDGDCAQGKRVRNSVCSETHTTE